MANGAWRWLIAAACPSTAWSVWCLVIDLYNDYGDSKGYCYLCNDLVGLLMNLSTCLAYYSYSQKIMTCLQENDVAYAWNQESCMVKLHSILTCTYYIKQL